MTSPARAAGGRARCRYHAARGVTIRAIGPEGWPVAERPVDDPGAITVESVAEALRAGVRNDTGWTPRIVVLAPDGRDITSAYRVD